MRTGRRLLMIACCAAMLGMVASRSANAEPKKAWIDFGICIEGCLINCPCTILDPIIIT